MKNVGARRSLIRLQWAAIFSMLRDTFRVRLLNKMKDQPHYCVSCTSKRYYWEKALLLLMKNVGARRSLIRLQWAAIFSMWIPLLAIFGLFSVLPIQQSTNESYAIKMAEPNCKKDEKRNLPTMASLRFKNMKECWTVCYAQIYSELLSCLAVGWKNHL